MRNLKLVHVIIGLMSGMAVISSSHGQLPSCRLSGGNVGSDGGNYYQFGGVAGANTALQPQPTGEWTHHQQFGPSGSFIFHTGTASAPPGSEIIEVRCSDPGGCSPSGNPPSPSKQVDFDCIGTFKNISDRAQPAIKPTWLISGANVIPEDITSQTFNGTYHYCEVNIDDNGEGPDSYDSSRCPPDGFGEKSTTGGADCDCPDFYRITIYDGVDAANVELLSNGLVDPSTLNQTDVIYEVEGYIKNGNGLQIHTLTGFDLL